MRRLRTQELASFDGEHVRFSPSYQWPKPVQPAGPPVVIGGRAGPKIFDHIAEYADGWAPIGTKQIVEGLPDLQRAFAAAGRDPGSIRLHAFDPRADVETIDRYAELGVERLVLTVPSTGADELARHLDELAPLIDRAA